MKCDGKKYVLGLDIGIASVGWGIIDLDNGSVVDAGSRLFSEGTAANNVDRRAFRSQRRLIRRKANRLKDLKDILKEENIIDDKFVPLNNPYEIRVKGLNSKLTNDELATAIYHIVKKRGLVNDEYIPDEANIKENQTSKMIFSHNEKELNDKKYYVCELQLERLNTIGNVRGTENLFKTLDYIKELNQIFDNQQLSENFKEKIINLIRRKREYYEGPGSKKSPTPYGRFYYENGQLIEIDMIEKMRGKCSIYPDELRASKMSYTADLFNFLNDLNNLTYDGVKISPEQKHEIVENYINKKGNITPLELSKYLDCDLEKITGFRVDKNDKKILTEFKGYNAIRKLVDKNKLNSKILDNKSVIDEIINVLTSKKGVAERSEAIRKIHDIDLSLFTDEIISQLANLSGISGYHSLSLKVMNEIIPDLFNTEYNQMQIFSMNNYFEHNKQNYKGLKEIPHNIDDILSPVVKRSQSEAIKIVNRVRKLYGELDTIVIEMPRDKNSDDEKKRLKDEQANGERLNNEVEELLKGRNASAETRRKIRLYKQQGGKCLYSGKDIDLNLLIDDPYRFEIDHIIPLSVSFDDSMNNKVLVYREENQKKGQRTPYQYFKSQNGNAGWNYEDYKNYVISLYKSKQMKSKKLNNLLFEEDINKYEVRKKFIERNIVDTRYASRSILNNLTSYFKSNEIDTKIHTVRVSVTSMFRKKSGIEKHRDEDYKHHAIDALIIAGIKKMKLMDNVLNALLYKDEENGLLRYNSLTGTLLDEINEEEFFDKKYLDFIKSLKTLQVKYSHKVDKKFNRPISNQTIYSVRNIDGVDYIMGRLTNIYGDDGEKLAKFFREGKAKEKLLMYKENRDTFEILEEICNHYKDEKNPFAKHQEITGEYICKCSKKGKGPIIKNIRYIDKKLGNYLDVSHNYQVDDNKKVVLLSLTPYRLDLYKCKDGKYRFINIQQLDISTKAGKSFIKPERYIELMDRHAIKQDDQFLFSVYKNELLKIKPASKVPVDEETPLPDDYKGIIICKGCYDAKNVYISFSPYNKPKLVYKGKEQSQSYLGIRDVENIIKLETDVLGNIYEYKPPLNNKPKLELN